MNTQDREELIVDGFQFSNERDAQAAKSEQDKVKLLESRLDYAYPDQVRMIYDKAIQNRIFKTPIGYTYLHTLQKYLQDQLPGEEIRSVPLFMNYVNSMRSATSPARQRVEPKKAEPEPAEKRLKAAHILNIFLAGIIIVMFIITMNGETPNILNYENVLVNRYAEWDEELTQREKVIREKEKSLNITPESTKSSVEDHKSGT
ncbi:MAG: hypothetical protein PHE02_07050 [Lachnospiraceae bacterium]|nr:hypothetical protein [Lachnospiraceae bacterium]